MRDATKRGESLLHPELDSALDIEDEIARRLLQATAIARLVVNADAGHCGEVLQNTGWLLECLLNDAGELVDCLKDAHKKEVELRRAGAPAGGCGNG